MDLFEQFGGGMPSDTQLCQLLTNAAYLTPNQTRILEEDDVYVSQLSLVTYGYITPAIIIIGIIGDILTVYTLTHPLLRRNSIIYTYLTLLAMTDLLTQLSVMPMVLWLINVRFCSSVAAFFYAHVGFPLANALMGASVWIVVFLTLSQYMAVCRPFTYGMRSRKICFALFAVAYLFNFCMYAPWAMKKRVVNVKDEYRRDHICPYVVCDAPLSDLFKVYEITREVLCRIVPFFVILFLNGSILFTYRKTKNDRMKRLTNSQKRFVTEKSEKEEKRLFTLLFAICIIFFVCTIPAAPLTILVKDELSKNLVFQVIRAVINVLEFTKFALNFYFYCLINPEIRSITWHVITCKKLHRPARVKGQPVTPISMYTKSTKSRGEKEGNGSSDSRRNSSLKNGHKKSQEMMGEGRQRSNTVVQADVLSDKLTVIRESDTDEMGDKI